MKTGWFGKPGIAKGTQTHVVDGDTIPICSYRPAEDYEFHFSVTGVLLEYIECARCKQKVRDVPALSAFSIVDRVRA